MSDTAVAETTKPRVRVNAKQTSKGEWYFDITCETDDVDESLRLLDEAVLKAQSKFEARGRKLAS